MLEQSRFRYLSLALLVIFILGFASLAYWFGGYRTRLQLDSINQPTGDFQQFIAEGKEKTDNQVDFNLFWEVWDFVLKEYVDHDQLTNEQLFYGALDGIVRATGDPYSMFLDPAMNKELQIDLTGTFEGIGAEIGMKNDMITVIAPLEGMPAEKAGLKSGDQIAKIDGELTFGLTVMEAVNKIRGEKNTDVVLTVLRADQEAPLGITITRGVITVKSVETSMLDNDIFVIKVTNFSDDTNILLNQAVGQVLLNDPQGIILDLRNNPGGYLQSAVFMASQWLEDGVVVTEKYSEDMSQDHYVDGLSRLSGYPTVVLVNQGSASASEIVAGALQDNEQAVIIGKQTFGKGSVQVLRDLSDGSALKITTAKWLTPKGRDINAEGIMPDLEVDYTIEDFENDIDPQLDKAIEMLANPQMIEEILQLAQARQPVVEKTIEDMVQTNTVNP